MGYEKEIILFKRKEYINFSGLDLLEKLKECSWKPTLSIINRGNDFNWIVANSEIEFEQILRDKVKNNEYIGFTL